MNKVYTEIVNLFKNNLVHLEIKDTLLNAPQSIARTPNIDELIESLKTMKKLKYVEFQNIDVCSTDSVNNITYDANFESNIEKFHFYTDNCNEILYTLPHILPLLLNCFEFKFTSNNIDTIFQTLHHHSVKNYVNIVKNIKYLNVQNIFTSDVESPRIKYYKATNKFSKECQKFLDKNNIKINLSNFESINELKICGNFDKNTSLKLSVHQPKNVTITKIYTNN
jgi:hypothetical protein